jgi:hypothetical protein
MMTFKTGAIYPTFFMVTEITAVSDNMNWYIKILLLPRLQGTFIGSLLHDRILPIVRALSFWVGRVWIGPYSIYKSAMITGGRSYLLQGWMRLPWYLALSGSSIILLFCFLNIVWTLVITKKCFKLSHKKRRMSN